MNVASRIPVDKATRKIEMDILKRRPALRPPLATSHSRLRSVGIKEQVVRCMCYQTIAQRKTLRCYNLALFYIGSSVQGEKCKNRAVQGKAWNEARRNKHDVIGRFLLWHYNYLLYPLYAGTLQCMTNQQHIVEQNHSIFLCLCCSGIL